MTFLGRSIDADPISVKFVHQSAPVARDGDFPFYLLQQPGKVLVLLVAHLKSICLGVAPSLMRIGRVTVEEGPLVVIQADDFGSRAVLDLYSKQPLGNGRQHIDAAEPARHDSRHSRPACILAIGPAAQGSCLRQAGAHLASANKESPRSFDFSKPMIRQA